VLLSKRRGQLKQVIDSMETLPRPCLVRFRPGWCTAAGSQACASTSPQSTRFLKTWG
jgi:hypothetical protein